MPEVSPPGLQRQERGGDCGERNARDGDKDNHA